MSVQQPTQNELLGFNSCSSLGSNSHFIETNINEKSAWIMNMHRQTSSSMQSDAHGEGTALTKYTEMDSKWPPAIQEKNIDVRMGSSLISTWSMQHNSDQKGKQMFSSC